MLENSESKALIVSADLADVAEQAAADLPRLTLRLLVGADRSPGWEDYAATVAGRRRPRSAPNSRGRRCSTPRGPPAGRRASCTPRSTWTAGSATWRATSSGSTATGSDTDTVTLNVGPLYHAAPLVSAMSTHRHGGTVVLLPKFDAEQTLKAIERYRVTYVQFVPTMFIRLLRLPEAVRRRYDVSSLRAVAHSAAPCPVEVKRQMIEWFGPVIYEYYSATEAAGHVSIRSEEVA